MRIKSFLLVFSIVFFSASSNAQFSRYIIQLKDKAGSAYSVNDPSRFLSQRAIDRRSRYNIAITENDLPVNQRYIDSIASAGNVTILNVSKWFNQVCIKTTDANALAKINSFSFVVKSAPVGARPAGILPLNKQLDVPITNNSNPTLQRPLEPGSSYYSYGLSAGQVQMHNTDLLHNLGFHGEGVQIAITDAGFLNYKTLPTFDSVRNSSRVLETWDFVANDTAVNEDNLHGMKCFSAIAANMPGKFVGTAPGASFYLYRTEDAASENPVEEQYWVAAAERADSLGADVISVSLGYNLFDNSSFNYSYTDMNGHTSLISKGVNAASAKGILVVVAAGNNGADGWHYITTPGDADEALAVGAVDINRQPASFSSYGPSSDGQIKPDVAGLGLAAVVANQATGNPEYGNGTSYACPIMAGIASCLWQAFPEETNSSVMSALRQSADRYTNPDDRTGYGIPDVKKAFVLLCKKQYSQQLTIDNSCTAKYSWSIKTGFNTKFIIERKLAGENSYSEAGTQTATNNFLKQDFVFTDDLSSISSPVAIQYRIKMTIGTDTSFYLDSSTVNYNSSCAVQDKITIAPNPVVDDLKISISKDQQYQVSIAIYNTAGQIVYQLNKQPVDRAQTFTVPMKHLSRGVYYVNLLVNDKKLSTKKIIRQ